MRRLVRRLLEACGVDWRGRLRRLDAWSLGRAAAEQGLAGLVGRLREIEPDLSRQYTAAREHDAFTEAKTRCQHAFQCALMLRAVELLPPGRLTVVDVGDSAGTHMKYLRALAGSDRELDTLGVNCDPVAVEKIRARGQAALLCRAEDLDLGGRRVDLFTSFEMLEHLHDPAGFLRRIARSGVGEHFVVTVPYRRRSRVGLYSARFPEGRTRTAEDEHVYEFSPEDWTLLFLHGGWRLVESRTWYQYPRGLPVVSGLLRRRWRRFDFEGFWGAILRRDLSVSDRYLGWSP